MPGSERRLVKRQEYQPMVSIYSMPSFLTNFHVGNDGCAANNESFDGNELIDVWQQFLDYDIRCVLMHFAAHLVDSILAY